MNLIVRKWVWHRGNGIGMAFRDPVWFDVLVEKCTDIEQNQRLGKKVLHCRRASVWHRLIPLLHHLSIHLNDTGCRALKLWKPVREKTPFEIPILLRVSMGGVRNSEWLKYLGLKVSADISEGPCKGLVESGCGWRRPWGGLHGKTDSANSCHPYTISALNPEGLSPLKQAAPPLWMLALAPYFCFLSISHLK